MPIKVHRLYSSSVLSRTKPPTSWLQYAHWVVDGGIEEEWDAYLQQLDAMGLQEYISIQLDAYNAYQESLE